MNPVIELTLFVTNLILFFFLLTHILLFIFWQCTKKKEQRTQITPSVSLIIAMYNEEKSILKCLEHVVKNNYPKLQLIIVDDGSNDTSQKIVSEFFHQFQAGKTIVQNVQNQEKSPYDASLTRDTTFLLLKTPHVGKSAALNEAIKHVKNEIIVSIDADTLIESHFIQHIVQPFADKHVGAVSGNVSVLNESDSILTTFQVLEYHYNNLIRSLFSHVFKQGIWFFGSVAAYRTAVLKKIKGFSLTSISEDMDISLKVRAAGYKTETADTALAKTIVPSSIVALYKQRKRWWMGSLESLFLRRKELSKTVDFSLAFLYANQIWWSIFSWIIIPLILYQIAFWWPQTAFEQTQYILRWLSIGGPWYYVYKILIGDWEVRLFSLLGVLSGLISQIMLLISLNIYKQKFRPKLIISFICYFPYTLIINTFIVIGMISFRRSKSGYVK